MGLSCLKIIPQNTETVFLRDIFASSSIDIPGFAKLLGLNIQTELPDSATPSVEILPPDSAVDGSLFFANSRLKIFIKREQKSFKIIPLYKNSPEFRVANWKIILSLLVLSAMLQGSKIVPVHGAMLSVRDGALLLCGESGVGKSTTARRFAAIGGNAPADDLMLLSYAGNELHIHPMPTWSKCMESVEGLSYNFDAAEPLCGCLCIARAVAGETEKILPVSDAEFFTQIYSSFFYFTSYLCKSMPLKEEEIRGLMQTVRGGVDAVIAKYPPRALFAALDGNLKNSLEEFL